MLGLLECITYKHKTARNVCYGRSNTCLIETIVNHGRKMFYNNGPRRKKKMAYVIFKVTVLKS
jgi:hypothetical protein